MLHAAFLSMIVCLIPFACTCSYGFIGPRSFLFWPLSRNGSCGRMLVSCPSKETLAWLRAPQFIDSSSWFSSKICLTFETRPWLSWVLVCWCSPARAGDLTTAAQSQVPLTGNFCSRALYCVVQEFSLPHHDLNASPAQSFFSIIPTLYSSRNHLQ